MKTSLRQISVFLIVFTLLVASDAVLTKTAVYAAPPAQPIEVQMKQWEANAQQRVLLRQQLMREIPRKASWPLNESIMSKEKALLYLESMNRLDLKYPWAVPLTKVIYRKALEQLQLLDVSKRGAHSQAKKEAAFRYLNQTPVRKDPAGSGLDNQEVLSLAWTAIEDKSIFPTKQDEEDRIWGLLEALANIQRAKNECEKTGAVVWHEGKDKQSCEVGRFIRLLEHLDSLHPSVHLTPTIAKISVQDVVHAIQQEHLRLRDYVSAETCQRIKANSQSSSHSFYQSYVNRLIDEVHASNPSISLEKIKEQTGRETMEALFDTSEWDGCPVHPIQNQNQNPIPQVTQAGAPESAAPVHSNEFLELMLDESRVTQAFAALGSMYQVGNVIWSGAFQQEESEGILGIGAREGGVVKLTWQAADQFCRKLGGGARLPSRDEYAALARALGHPNRYQPGRLPDTRGNRFWSLTVNPTDSGRYFAFNGSSGASYNDFDKRFATGSVRCVVFVGLEGEGNPEPVAVQGAQTGQTVQAQQSVAAPAPLQPNEQLQPMKDESRVNPAFAELGKMFQVGNVIWSGVARGERKRGFLGIITTAGDVQNMTWTKADEFCRSLGGGARLPTHAEFEALARALGFPNNYRPNLLPDVRDRQFWSSSVHSRNGRQPLYRYFKGENGSIGAAPGTYEDVSARCVVLVN